MNAARLGLFVAVCALFIRQDAIAQQCTPREAVTNFGEWFDVEKTFSASHLNGTVAADLPFYQAASMKLLVEVDSGTDKQWHLVIREPSYRVLASLGARDFEDSHGKLTQKRWTGRLYETRVLIDLIASKTSDVKIRVSRGIALPEQTSGETLFSIQSAVANWDELYRSQDVIPRRAGDKVGMLMSGQWNPQTGQKSSWCCSSVMVGPDLMLTNWHCGGDIWMPSAAYWKGDVCSNTTIDLAWDGGTVRRQYNCVRVEEENQRLDFAILRVLPVIGVGGLSGEPVYERLSRNSSAGDIFMIHHAMCKPKLLSKACRVESVDYDNWLNDGTITDFTHTCDTETGASGAPIFDIEGHVVGLHHVGFDRKANCEPADHVNKGIKITEIINFLIVKNTALSAELGLR